jgi:hypothetical protein
MVQPRRVRFVQRLPPPVLIGAAIVGIVALVVLGISASGDDDTVPAIDVAPSTVVARPLPDPPAGVTPQRYEPDDLGVVLQVPSTWVERDGEEGYDAVVEAPGGDAFVFVDRRDITEGRGRADELERLGATIEDERTTDLDGHDAQVLRYDAPFPGRGLGTATEVDVDLRDGTFAIVVVAALEEADIDREVLEWVLDAVRVAEG